MRFQAFFYFMKGSLFRNYSFIHPFYDKKRRKLASSYLNLLKMKTKVSFCLSPIFFDSWMICQLVFRQFSAMNFFVLY